MKRSFDQISFLFVSPASVLVWLTILIFSGCSTKQALPDLARFVDPFIGTGGHGHTFPGATAPFGMVQLSPDTRLKGWDGCAGYHFSDTILYGFSHTHLSGTGVSDYGDILFMPFSGSREFETGFTEPYYPFAAPFSHENELAEPGYYSVLLPHDSIYAEVSATTRAGIHRYTFRKKSNANILLDLVHRDEVIESFLRIRNQYEIEGFRRSSAWAKDQRIYFVAKFSRPFLSHSILLSDSLIHTGNYAEGKSIRAIFRFPCAAGESIMVKIGISAVDTKGASKNLVAGIKDFDFDGVRKETREKWNAELNRIVVQSDNQTELRKFYTAMYHCMIAPNIYHDVDGRFRGRDMKIYQSRKFENHTVFSLWDTFRATHPLFTIIQQDRTNDFVQSMLVQHEQGGSLPVWELSGNETNCMIGYHSVPVIADAWLKGIRGFDGKMALQAALQSANSGKSGIANYMENDYIDASKEGESVSKTLEYAFDDWCISRLASSLGEKEIAKVFMNRSGNFRNLFDPESKFFRAKKNGTFSGPFDPSEVNFHYTEANAWQYSLFVPHDLSTLVNLHGGMDEFEKHLDNMFRSSAIPTGREQADITGLIGQYAHGNEPSHHMAYLYNLTSHPAKGDAILNDIMDNLYSDLPDGLPGNEDCGQMSAWYVFSALGFYPVNPAEGRYWIGSPRFEKIEINLENGRTTRIYVEPGARPLRGVEIEGKRSVRRWLTHDELTSGAEIRLIREGNPMDQAGAKGLLTSTLSYEKNPVPFFKASGHSFRDSMQVLIGVVGDCKIHYTTDGTEPAMSSAVYSKPIELKNTATIRAVSEQKNGKVSKVNSGEFRKVTGNLKLFSRYDSQYSAGGEVALIDGLQGGSDFRSGLWQGYREDFSVEFDLGGIKSKGLISIGFLQDAGSWIWMPRSVEFSYSANGISWTPGKTETNLASDRNSDAIVSRIQFPIENDKPMRFIRIRAIQYGVCPDWHPGAGGKSWIFSDEITFSESDLP